MKLVTFIADRDARLGALHDGKVIDLAVASGNRLPGNMLEFLQQGEQAMDVARKVLEHTGDGRPLSEVRLLAPVPTPSKVVAVGLNYMDHCREQGHAPPKSPVLFAKFPTAIIGPGEPIRWDPSLTSQVDYEVELAVVIGRRARRVAAANALQHVAGYTICNDVSARDLQFGDGQWVRAKSLDTFCPLGPYLATRDEIPDPQNLHLRTTVNGEVRQDSSTAEMIFGVAELIEFISRAFTLLPGDVIITGTPHGVGVFRDPPTFLRDGDVVTVEIEGLGQLANPCEEE